ncbi:MAG: polyphosphate polymerase domain-containing protein [Faecousia sp.]
MTPQAVHQTVFQRYEIKYLLHPQEKETIYRAMEPYMTPDLYGKTTIRSLYFDTDNYRLIRRSLEKPVYKEKLRLRSYDRAEPDSEVFVELKKKYASVVYKRRVELPEQEAMGWLLGNCPCQRSSQISREIGYVLDYYESLRPAVFLSYDRVAYCGKDPPDLRVTFDSNILCRQQDLSLQAPVYGTLLLAPELTLMEVKCAAGLPLWLAKVLSEHHIYATSFSKYGAAYEQVIYPSLLRRDVPGRKESVSHV